MKVGIKKYETKKMTWNDDNKCVNDVNGRVDTSP
jgi:hypothetical protein